MASPFATLKPGEYSTNSALQADLGKTVVLNGCEYRLCKTQAAITTAGGYAVVTSYTAGVPTWSVSPSTTLNSVDCVGGVPIAATTFVGYIDSTITVPISAYLLVQYYGPGKVLAANTTIVAGAVFGASSLGYASSIDSAVYAPGAVRGRMTNTAAASAAAVPLTCIWGI